MGIMLPKLCYDLVLNGYDDWFLPSKDELNLMYNNLHKKGLGCFGSFSFWSSSEYYSKYAWRQYFVTGYQYNFDKNFNNMVRAVRAF